MADLSNIVVLPTNDGVMVECQLCEGHKHYRTDPPTLAELVADMIDHLERNHA